jgi:hypothetical protein
LQVLYEAVFKVSLVEEGGEDKGKRMRGKKRKG